MYSRCVSQTSAVHSLLTAISDFISFKCIFVNNDLESEKHFKKLECPKCTKKFEEINNISRLQSEPYIDFGEKLELSVQVFVERDFSTNNVDK